MTTEKLFSAALQDKTPQEKNLWLLDICYHESNLERARQALWHLTWLPSAEFLAQLAKITKFRKLGSYLEDYSSAIASRPEMFQVLVALAANRGELLANGGKDVVIALVQLCHAQVKKLPQKAQRALAMLENQDAHEAVCKFALDKRYHLALQVAIKQNFYPPDLHKRALFYFLSRQWKKYERLDFDARLMRIVYQNANQELRRQITEVGRTAGRAEMLQIVGAEKWANLSLQEWQVVTRTLLEGKRWEEAWQMVQIAPPDYAFMLLQTLIEKKWQPEPADQKTVFESLSGHIKQLKTPRAPFGGALKLLTEFKPAVPKPQMRNFFISPGNRLLEMAISTRLPGQATEFQSVIWDVAEHKLTQEITGATWTGKSGSYQSIKLSNPNITFLENGVGGLITPEFIQISKRRLETEVFQIPHKYKRAYAVAVSADGARLITGHFRIIAVWDLARRVLIKAYEAHTSFVFQLILDENNRHLTSVDMSGEIKVWYSALNELTMTPLGKISEQQLQAVQKLAEIGKLYAEDATWLDVIASLYAYRFRYDIEVTEINQIEASYFDIELEE